MGAIVTTCKRCGEQYIAGMVGSTPWPAHVCPPQGTWANLRFQLYRYLVADRIAHFRVMRGVRRQARSIRAQTRSRDDA